VIAGFNGIWKEAYGTAAKHNEKGKYLMTFQNYLTQIPKWSQAIVQAEVERIVEKSGCNYLEDLLSCVHVIQLKALSCMRVGTRQKKVDIDIPSLPTFVHNLYTNCARKIYTNVYLFETDVPSLQIQKNNRELELIIRECIMNTIRESVPTEQILRAYMDETMEDETETKVELVKEEVEGRPSDESANEATGEGTEGESQSKTDDTVTGELEAKKTETSDVEPMKLDSLSAALTIDTESTEDKSDKPSTTSVAKLGAENDTETRDDLERPATLSFNDKDEAITVDGKLEKIDAPKTIDRLEQISTESFAKRKAEEDEDDELLNIGDSVELAIDELISLDEPKF
jgi:hypothetical protein